MSKLNLKEKILTIFFLSLPFVDLLTSLSTRFIDSPITIGVVVKGLSLAISVIYVFFYSPNKYKKHITVYITCICIFAGIYFLTKPDIWTLSSFLTEIIYAFKYLYFPIITPCLYVMFHDFDIKVRLIKYIITIDCFAYAALMLIPYFTGTGFVSYEWSFGGTTGWFYAANEIGAILAVLSICIFDLMDNNKKWQILLAAPIIYSVSIMGTKVSYLGIIASVMVSVLIFILSHKTNRYTLPSSLLAILLVCCVSSVAVENMGTLSDMDVLPPPSTEIETEISTELEDPLENIPQTTIDYIYGNKLLNMVNRLTSNRLLYFMENWKPYTAGGLSTILFGLGWAPRTTINYTYYKQLVEIDVLDILLHYGVIGFLVYFAPFAYLAYRYIRNIRRVSISSYAYILATLLGIGISCIAGHVLGAPSVSIYLALLIVLIIRQTEEKQIKVRE